MHREQPESGFKACASGSSLDANQLNAPLKGEIAREKITPARRLPGPTWGEGRMRGEGWRPGSLLHPGPPTVAAVYDVTLNFRGNKNPSLLGILYGKKYEADMCVR